jgi:transposase-like protein
VVAAPVSGLKGGRDYPRDQGELRAWFSTDEACADYLAWLRWPNGFVCPRCGVIGSGCKLGDGRWWCYGCRRRVSVTAGTIFHRSKTPLTVWFAAAWLMVVEKPGYSAMSLKRDLNIGSYETAWAMLHRYRRAMSPPDLDRLRGHVEVDETYFGAPHAGPPGRGALGKITVFVAVEFEPLPKKGFGRARMLVLPKTQRLNATAAAWALNEMVEPGAVVYTDGAGIYPPACQGVYPLVQVNVARSTRPSHLLLPASNQAIGLVKRWLMSTHQGAVEEDHLQHYLNEFCFRFNRRRSRSRGLLFYRLLERAIAAPVTTRASMLVNPGQAKRMPPKSPVKRARNSPASLAAASKGRPWRP